MKILAVDQARSGAWAIFDYEKRLLLRYGTFKFDAEHYTFPRAVMEIEKLIWGVISRYRVDAVFLEDIQLRANVQSFKKLAQLQGVLVNTLERHDYLYDLIQPTAWQNYCNARGRSSAEAKKKLEETGNKLKASSIALAEKTRAAEEAAELISKLKAGQTLAASARRIADSFSASALKIADSFSPSATRIADFFSPSACKIFSRRSRSAFICFSMES